ncbi:helix-turn-helix domain-containing protein [Helicobacter himalayensis]|uniref:helix-turn-helix domain-containing protein n=1 Tax=Helicobacter himalayensis TaxID=1591088 RepID=UPI003D6F7C32
MEKREFKVLLARAKLSQKDFAQMVGISPQSVNNWGCSKEFPYWVKSYLENYIELLGYRDLKARLKETGICS